MEDQTMKIQSVGQSVLIKMAEWLESFTTFPTIPQGQALIAALWCVHTWFAPRWPVTAYAHITADGPGCGKSNLLEELAALSANAKVRSTLRPLEMVRAIQQANEDSGVPVITFFLDEMEKLSHMAAGDARSILTTGYKVGGQHAISVGQKSVEFSTYCAKAFASIGTLDDVFRSRAIVFRLSYGKPARSWSDAILTRKAEAERLIAEMAKALPKQPEWIPAEELQGREREIWTPILSTAKALNLDDETMARVRAAMHDMIEYKITCESKTYRELRTEPKDQERVYAERCLRDVVTVAGSADHIWTAVALAKLLELPAAPWRVFRGKGLDAMSLQALLSAYARPEDPKLIKRHGKAARGYHMAALRSALAKLDNPTD